MTTARILAAKKSQREKKKVACREKEELEFDWEGELSFPESTKVTPLPPPAQEEVERFRERLRFAHARGYVLNRRSRFVKARK